MLKTFIIEDEGMYERAVAYMTEYASGSAETLTKELGELIRAAAGVKAGVVSRDQFEKGERRVLNLGHTFAHAIETLAQREAPGPDMPVLSLNKPEATITHGEAVAMGMVMAAKLSDRQRKSKDGLAAKLVRDFKACGLPVDCPYSIEQMAEAMSKDKKAESGKVHFILPREIGRVEIVDLTVDEVVKLLK